MTTQLIDAVNKGQPVDILTRILDTAVDVNEVSGDDNRTALHIASSDNDVDTVRVLLDHRADTEVRDNQNFTALHSAISAGSTEVVELLLASGAKMAPLRRTTPLLLACKHGYLDILKILVRHGAPVQPRGAQPRKSGLQYAIERNRVDIATYLVDNGACASAIGPGGITNLMYAVLTTPTSPAIIELFLPYSGPFYDLPHPTSGLNVVQLVCKLDKLAVLQQMLVEHAALVHLDQLDPHRESLMDIAIFYGSRSVFVFLRQTLGPDWVDETGETPLIKASKSGDLPPVTMMVECGENINQTDKWGVTALTHAARCTYTRSASDNPRRVKCLGVAKYLAQMGANGDEAYTANPQLLQHRMMSSSRAGVTYWDATKYLHTLLLGDIAVDQIRQCILEGADVDAIMRNNHTPLVFACAVNKLDYVITLLDAGANIHKCDPTSSNPLTKAGECGHTAIAVYLLERGAALHGSDWLPHSPLTLACSNGHFKTVEALLKKGVDIDDKDSDGNTSLVAAILHEHVSVLQLLIDNGAKVNMCNSDGVTPLMMATSTKNMDIINILEKSGAHIDMEVFILTERFRLLSIGHSVHAGAEENSTFTNTFSSDDLLLSTSSRRPVLGVCGYIHEIKLEDGRCVHIASRDARRVMMRLLNTPVDPNRIILPIQSSGTCWFFTGIVSLFVSDGTRKALLPLRRSMVMGRTSPNEPRFEKPVVVAMAKLNTMIQAVLDGNSKTRGVRNVTLPLIQSEEVVVDMFKAGLSESSLCGGGNPQTFAQLLVNILSPRDLFVMFNKDRIGRYDEDPVARMVPYSQELASTLVIHGKKYVLDSALLYTPTHVVAAITLGGVRRVYDSNHGIVNVNWFGYFKHPTKTFKVGRTDYSFGNSRFSPSLLYVREN